MIMIDLGAGKTQVEGITIEVAAELGMLTHAVVQDIYEGALEVTGEGCEEEAAEMTSHMIASAWMAASAIDDTGVIEKAFEKAMILKERDNGEAEFFFQKKRSREEMGSAMQERVRRGMGRSRRR